jgi:hypothetical protein
MKIMKRNSSLTLRGLSVAILGGIAILSSCRQDEPAQGFSDPSREVTFVAYAKEGSSTRATETTSGTISTFTVYGIWSEGNTLLDNLKPAEVSGSNPNNWTYDPKELWPDAGTIGFYAFSPTEATSNGLTDNIATNKKITYTVPARENQQDLLVAVNPTVSCITPVPVSLHFQHALSRIQLRARSALGTAYTIKGAEFINLSNEATLELSGSNIPNGSAFTYKDNTSLEPLVLWTDHNTAETDYAFSFSTPVEVSSQTEYADLIVGSDALLVLPQKTELGESVAINGNNPEDGKFYVKITYTSEDDPTEKSKFYAVKEPLDPVKNRPLTFEIGRNYTFLVELSGSNNIAFVNVLVSAFDNAFGDMDITPDPDPATTPDYKPRTHQGFAGSNIYWDADNKRLTFDDVDVTTNEENQGVFFKWGSLVGISPVGAWNEDENDRENNTVVYIPTGINGTYVKSDAYSVGGWEGIEAADAADATDFDREVGYVTYLNSDLDNFADFKGDICAYLSGRPGIPAGYWRLPTSGDFGDADLYTRKGAVNEKGTSTIADDVFIWTETSDDAVDGTYKVSNGYDYSYFFGKTAFFPNSGYRNYPDGELRAVGRGGLLWSSSPAADDRVFYLGFEASVVGADYRTFRDNGSSVRCVKK